MPLDPDKLELKFDGCPFGVSARRIHEHMTLAQINPFARSLASVQSPRDAAANIGISVHMTATRPYLQPN